MLYYKVMAISGKPGDIMLPDIKEIIDKHNISIKTREKYTLFPRQYLMWWLRNNTKLSFVQIAKVCGGGVGDHATAFHACRLVDVLLEQKDPYFLSIIHDVDKDLRERFPNRTHNVHPVFNNIDYNLPIDVLYTKYRVHPRKLAKALGVVEHTIKQRL